MASHPFLENTSAHLFCASMCLILANCFRIRALTASFLAHVAAVVKVVRVAVTEDEILRNQFAEADFEEEQKNLFEK